MFAIRFEIIGYNGNTNAFDKVMENPTEKAKQLVGRINEIQFSQYGYIISLPIEAAKHGALIVVDEIEKHSGKGNHYNPNIQYWKNVKEEIKKL